MGGCSNCGQEGSVVAQGGGSFCMWCGTVVEGAVATRAAVEVKGGDDYVATDEFEGKTIEYWCPRKQARYVPDLAVNEALLAFHQWRLRGEIERERAG